MSREGADLGVVTELESVDEASSAGDDVLECAAHFDGDGVGNDGHAEVVRLDQLLVDRPGNLE
jgi:hypothetical protein